MLVGRNNNIVWDYGGETIDVTGLIECPRAHGALGPNRAGRPWPAVFLFLLRRQVRLKRTLPYVAYVGHILGRGGEDGHGPPEQFCIFTYLVHDVSNNSRGMSTKV